MKIMTATNCPASARQTIQRYSGKRSSGLTLVMSALLFFSFQSAQAERSDRERPVNIEAAHAVKDDLKQTQVFTGDVVLTKGSIIIRADQLTLRQDPEGYQYATAVTGQAGKLVYFRQKREGLDQYIEGQAERIEYAEKSDKIKLFNHAIVKRLEASKPADEIRGDTIDYDSRTEVYTAQSDGPGNSSTTTSQSDGRVHVVIQPRIAPAAPPTQQPGEPAASGLQLSPAINTPPRE
jgi:lipopolysaccharide export system protein LptA